MLLTAFLTACVLCACGLVLSLTYRAWPVERAGRPYAVRLAALAGIAAVLTLVPAALPHGAALDVRAAPLAFALLRAGPLAGAVVAAALLAATVLTGPLPTAAAPGVPGAALAGAGVLAALLLGSGLRAALRPLAPARTRALRWPAAVLTVAAPPAVDALLGAPWPAAATSVLAGTAGYALLSAIVEHRVTLLRATSRWQSQALLDTLTGLANRRQFDQDLRTVGDGDAVLAVDIDHFKRVNDTHGHATGDRVLRAVGHALQATLRHHDRAYRLGGEEFAVLLRHVNRDQAQLVAERLRRAVEAAPMAGLTVTISVGVSTVAAGDAAAAVRQADVALYRAKQRGRNRTCTWQSGDLTALDVTKTMIGVM